RGMARLARIDAQLRAVASRREPVADHARLRHARVAFEVQRDRAQRVHAQVFRREHARRKRPHPQLVIESELLEHPQHAKRAGLLAVMKDAAHSALWPKALSTAITRNRFTISYQLVDFACCFPLTTARRSLAVFTIHA